MVDDIDRIAEIEDDVDALEASIAGARDIAASFDTELGQMRRTLDDAALNVKGLERSISGNLRRAFDDLILDGGKLSDVLRSAVSSITQNVYRSAVSPVFNQLGGVLGGALQGLFANGGAFSQGRVMPFASGGIVSGPTTFPMRGGTGLMGEAGPEAILPLQRGADGRLGVASQGGRATNVTVNITTPDYASFERSKAQVAAQMSRALAAGNRNR